jgi:hypothetical protein
MQIRKALILTSVILCSTAVSSAVDLTDPYEIMERHIEAVGGRDRLLEQTTSHITGRIEIVGTGLEGTIETWTEFPVKKRVEVDLGVIKQTIGDDGEFPWIVDQNGKLQIKKDEISIKSRKVEQLMSQLKHLDPESEHFTLTFQGTDTAAGAECYLVKIENDINSDVITSFIDKSTFYQVKTITVKSDGEEHAVFSDFRELDGIVVPFAEETTDYPTGMVQKITITSFERNVSVDPSKFDPPETDVRDFRFTHGFSAENIPFQLIENHIYIDVKVSGIKRLWVLDSGASISVIERKFADELGLEMQGEIKGRGVGNVVDVSLTTLPAFSLPGIEFEEQTAACIDLSWLFYETVGLDVSGLLGYDFLSRFVTRIDYANEVISVYDPDHFEYSGDGVVLDAPIGQGNTFVVPVTVDGQYTGNWTLDLGASGMSFHHGFAQENGLSGRKGVDRRTYGAGGPGTTKAVMFDDVEFAGFDVLHEVISIPYGRGEGAFSNTDIAGNIGNRLLRHFVLYLDYKNQQLIVEKGDDFDKDFPRNTTGLQIGLKSKDRIEVVFVATGTPAEEAGLQVGDQIKSIDGVPTGELGGMVEIRKMLRADPGKKYAFEVFRAGEFKKIDLVTRDLFN